MAIILGFLFAKGKDLRVKGKGARGAECAVEGIGQQRAK